MPLENITSQNGKTQLVVDGYVFTNEREFPTKKSSKCTKHWKYRCLGQCHTKGDRLVRHTGHNHTPRAASIKAKSLIHEIKAQARTTTDNPKNIIAAPSVNVSEAVAGTLPSIFQMKKTVQRTRKLENNVPMNLANLVELQIPHRYTWTSSGKPFLLYDSGPVNERILLFSTKKNLDLLASSEHLFADGTFKTAPNLFYQVYTIHGILQSTVVPLVYTLLSNKTQSINTKLLNEVKNLKPQLNPVSVMTDFETAAINAFNSEFSNIENRGCFSPFNQAIWRRIQQDTEILYNYKTDPDFVLKLSDWTEMSRQFRQQRVKVNGSS